jgi:hypothetical protein
MRHPNADWTHPMEDLEPTPEPEVHVEKKLWRAIRDCNDGVHLSERQMNLEQSQAFGFRIHMLSKFPAHVLKLGGASDELIIRIERNYGKLPT